MKKMSKLLALLLALVMLLSCMTACGKKEAPTVEEPAKTEEPKKEEPKAEEPKKEEEAPAEEESYLPLVKDGSATLTIGIMQNVNTVDYETNAYTKWLEEQTGVNLEFVYFSSDKTEAGQQLALMMNAGEKLPDILWTFSGVDGAARDEYGQDGYFVDLLPLIEEYGHFYTEMKSGMDNTNDRDLLEIYGATPDNGALYAMPSYQISPTADLITNHVLINQVWLDNLGLEMPGTVDELVNVLNKFINEDPNGNGVKDEMGMTGNIGRTRGNILEYVINAYVYCNDNYMYNIDDNGQLYLPYATDEYRQAMIKLNEMYAAGLISPISFTLPNDDVEMTAIFTPADGVSLTGIAAGHPTLITADEGWNAFEYRAAQALAAETELGGYLPRQTATFGWNTFITEDCADPVLAFKLLDFMYSEESVIRMRFGEYGVDWEYAPEGITALNGCPAKIVTLNGSAFSGQNNCTWHVLGTMILEYAKYATVTPDYDPNAPVEEMDFATRKSYQYNAVLSPAWFVMPEKSNVFFRNVLNTEETEVNNEYKKLFLQYVEEARALFVTGTLDPNNDTDWEQYLSNLEANGMSQLLEVNQAAYSRLTGK